MTRSMDDSRRRSYRRKSSQKTIVIEKAAMIKENLALSHRGARMGRTVPRTGHRDKGTADSHRHPSQRRIHPRLSRCLRSRYGTCASC
jgi:hypothetical protein